MNLTNPRDPPSPKTLALLLDKHDNVLGRRDRFPCSLLLAQTGSSNSRIPRRLPHIKHQTLNHPQSPQKTSVNQITTFKVSVQTPDNMIGIAVNRDACSMIRSRTLGLRLTDLTHRPASSSGAYATKI